MINVSKHNIPPLSYTYKPQQSIAQEIHLKLTKVMERVAPREDVFHNHSLNRLKPHFNYLDKPSITHNVNHPGQNESEINIFDAEKYFNGAHDSRENRNNHKNGGIYTMSNSKQPEAASIGRLSLSTPKQSISSISRLSSVSDDSYGRNYRARSYYTTPTASSEASWNSQTGLLIHPPCLAPVSITNLPSAGDRRSRKTSASMKWFLRGNRCPCSGKKSVNVEESKSESEASKTPTPPPPRIVQLNRITSSGGGYLYSSRQRNPKALPQPVRGMSKATLIPDEAITNFIARPQLDQNKLIPTNTKPNLEDQQRESRYPPERVAVTVRSFADGSVTSNGFTFPILSNSATPPNRMFNIIQPITVSAVGGSTGDTSRDSLEVFQPQDGRNLTFTASPESRRPSYEEELCSDASSDLFEIESFSTTTQSILFARQDSLDDSAPNFSLRRLQIATLNKAASSVAIEGLKDEDEEDMVMQSITPTECYPPSEVSVDWSVTTAEGFDRASRTSFSVSASEIGYATLRQAAKSGAGGIAGDGESKRRGNGGLLTSCRREKAVNVGPNPIKYQHAQRGGM